MSSNILIFGSINIDEVYEVDHIVHPGETLKANALEILPGGKGANQAVAVAKAGGRSFMAGKIANDGLFIKEYMESSGVDCSLVFIEEDKKLTSGKAIIQVDQQSGENSIVLFSGSNNRIGEKDIESVFNSDNLFNKGDLLLLQNEINNLNQIISISLKKGFEIIYNPAPFSKVILDEIPLNLIQVLILNQTEAIEFYNYLSNQTNNLKLKTINDWKQFQSDLINLLIKKISSIQLKSIIITLGSEGVLLTLIQNITSLSFTTIHLSSYLPPCKVLDTTGAGDNFIGYLTTELSKFNSLDNRYSLNNLKSAINKAMAASAIAITRKGAMISFPSKEEVEQFLNEPK